MKKSIIFLPLLLVSCGGIPVSSEVNNEAYFDDLQQANATTFGGDNVAIRLDNGKLDASAKIKDGDTYNNISIGANPLVFDLRFGGLKATELSGMKMSLLGKTSVAPSGSKLSLKGDSLPSGSILNNVSCIIDAYFDTVEVEGQSKNAFLLNLFNAGMVRTALNTLIQDKVEDKKDFNLPVRSYVLLGEGDDAEINKNLPIGQKLIDATVDIKDELLKAYKASPKEFTFSTSGEEKTILFETTSWQTFHNIVDAFDINTDEIASSLGVSEFSFDQSSLWNELDDKAVLKKFHLGVNFNSQGVSNIDFNAAISFKEIADGDLIPTGDWTFSGSVAISTGEAAKPKLLSEKEKGVYKEFQWNE